jgi:hypothetical protein
MPTSRENGAHSACVASTRARTGQISRESSPNKQIVRIIELTVSEHRAFMDVA